MASGDLEAGRSEREVEHARQELAIQRQRRANEARHEFLRMCPTGHAYDLPHAMTLLADLGGGNRSRRLQRTFLIRAMVAQGWSRAGITAAWHLEPGELEHELTRSIWWQPSDAERAGLSDEVRADLTVALLAERGTVA